MNLRNCGVRIIIIVKLWCRIEETKKWQIVTLAHIIILYQVKVNITVILFTIDQAESEKIIWYYFRSSVLKLKTENSFKNLLFI